MTKAEAEADAFIKTAVLKRERLLKIMENPRTAALYSMTEEDRQMIVGALRSVLANAEWAKP